MNEGELVRKKGVREKYTSSNRSESKERAMEEGEKVKEERKQKHCLMKIAGLK